MAIREDVVTSAITFLQDANVAAAPLDKRIAFLQSKNLTQEEIDAALSRAEGMRGGSDAAPQNYGYPPQQQQQQMMRPPQYGYGQYPNNYWQPPPPELPRRDWRDYFIMATVMSGLSYGVYTVAKRYIIPLIAPPTPPQLTTDKAAIDASFTQAFDLITQLASDTASLKASEESRKERLDTALTDVESTLTDLKSASRRRDEDTRRVVDEVHNLQAMIPKAMKAQEDLTETRLKELTAELKSLKTLVASRMAPAANAAPSPPASTSAGSSSTAPPAPPSRPSTAAGSGAGAGVGVGANMFTPSGTPNTGAVNTETSSTSDSTTIDNKPSSTTGSTASPYNRFASGRAGIPAWQLAASAAKKDAASSAGGASAGASGSATPTATSVDGAAA